MDKKYSLAIIFMSYVRSINFIASWTILIFLIYSVFYLHPVDISKSSGVQAFIVVVLAWGLTLKLLPFVYFLLPVAVELIWHDNTLTDMNPASLVATGVYFVLVIITQILAFKAVRYGYLDIAR